MNDKIISYKSYVAGWLDSSIHDFLEALSLRAVATKYALITSLDSNPHPALMLDKSPELKSNSHEFRILENSLLLPTDALLKIETSSRIFFGFDAVWFFPTQNVKTPPPTLLVGPSRLNQSQLNELGPWLSDNDCSLALGDGEGLNFVVKARGLVRFLLGFSMEQPEHSHSSV